MQLSKVLSLRRSPRIRRGLSSALLILLMPGCLGRQVASDGSNFRQALLDMYTDQAINNLIAARSNRPFVQLAYHDLNITDTQMAKLGLSNEVDPTHTSTVIAATGALLNSMRMVTDTLGFSASLECDRQFNFKADPAANSPDIYDYYQAFALDTGLLRESPEEPCVGVYLKKKCGDTWYWIPSEASSLFLQLVLKTAFLRGPDPAPPIYWQNVIASLETRYDENGAAVTPPDSDNFGYVLRFKSSTYSDFATATIFLANGDTVRLSLTPYDTVPFRPGIKNQHAVPSSVMTGASTDILYAQGSVQLKPADVADRPVQLYLPNEPQLAKKSAEALELEGLVKRFRANQGRTQ
jgi:hypothetical protein